LRQLWSKVTHHARRLAVRVVTVSMPILTEQDIFANGTVRAIALMVLQVVLVGVRRRQVTVPLVPTVVNVLRVLVVAATVAIPTEDPLVAQIAIATVAVAVVVQITTIPRPNATLVLMAKQVHLDLHHCHIVPRQKKVTVLLVTTVVNVLRVRVVAATVAIPTEDLLDVLIVIQMVIVACVTPTIIYHRYNVTLALMAKQVMLVALQLNLVRFQLSNHSNLVFGRPVLWMPKRVALFQFTVVLCAKLGALIVCVLLVVR